MTADFLLTSSFLTRHAYTLTAASGNSTAVMFSAIQAPPLPTWLGPTVRAFEALLQLRGNWDGYGAKEIQESPILESFKLLAEIAENDTPVPSIVPLSDGGVQMEWHRHGRDLEIEFSPDETPSFYYYQSSSGSEIESPVHENLELLRELVAEMK